MNADDPDLQDWLKRPVEDRALDCIVHVMMNLRDLPEFACDDSPLAASTLTTPIHIACIEAFFTNARLSAEFFWKMPKGDITARTFVPDWAPPAGIAKRMGRVWLLASRHVVHLSRDRVPVAPDDWSREDVSYGALVRIARDAYQAFTLFVAAYEAGGGNHAERLRESVTGVKPHTRKELAALRRGVAKPRPVVLEWW